jgi:CSLREA domain-containing protein/uncharacterized repeat protein (TIGR01451 family)
MLRKKYSIFMPIVLALFALGTVVLAMAIYMPSQAASNATYTVNTTADTNDGTCNAADCTLREAILAANDTPDADTIEFSLPPSSTITLGGTQLPPITGTLSIDGSTAENLTISGDNASRILVIGPEPPPYPGPSAGHVEAGIGSSAAVTLTNLHITEGNESNELGGGIYNGGTLTIVDSTISNLISKNGGIFNDHTLVITNSAVISNSIFGSYGAGAGIYNTSSGSLIVYDTAFIGNVNHTSGINSDGGGAIFNNGGYLSVANSEFRNNSSFGFGGGAINSRSIGTVNITNSIFISNSADSTGGAIFASGMVTVTHSTFISNTALNAGAFFTFDSDSAVNIFNSTFNNNSGLSNGGALFANGPTNVSNSTFSMNDAFSGGAIYIGSVAGELTIKNSTISDNSATSTGSGIRNLMTLNFSNNIIANGLNSSDCFSSGTIGTNVNNLVEDGSCNALFSGDPILGPLQDNGGDTLTHELLTGSPAIDTGDPATCAASPVDNLDQRGQIRPIDGDGDGVAVCDIGAYETGKLNISLFKDAPAAAAVGEPITYTLVVRNNLTDTVTSVVLTDTIPANANYISGGILVGNVVSWTTPSLNSGAGFTSTFVVTAAQTITNDDYRVSASGGYSATGKAAVVTIVAEPISGLNATNDSPTMIGDTTALTATIASGSDVDFMWSFGDGATDSGPTTSHLYVDVGQYTAVVTASNPLGIVTASTTVNIIDIPITGLAAGNDGPTILGESTTLFASITTGTNVVYTWDFGDGSGTSTNAPFVDHTYSATGVYIAMVTASNSNNSQNATTIVTINDAPITGLNAGNDGPTTLGNPTTLTASITGGTNVNYAWAFGDGTNGSGATVMHTYPDVGQYTAVVTATNSIGSVVDTTIVTIEQDTWTIYLPVVLRSDTNGIETAQSAPSPQNRVAILPRKLVFMQLNSLP